MTNINYYTVHRSGCSLKRDSLLDQNRLYINTEKLEIEDVKLFCEFNKLPEQVLLVCIFVVDNEIDYNSYNSLN